MIRIGISDAYDGGNIEFVEVEENGKITVCVKIKQDPYTDLEKMHHSQYFAFRATLSGIPRTKRADYRDSNNKTNKTTSVQVRYVIENASKVSYPDGWNGTTIFYSHDVEDASSWKRCLDTHYVDGKLSWTHEHIRNGPIYFSYFPPYSYSRHLSLISKCSMAPDAYVESLGQSLDGREIECITIGEGEQICWVIHRQHPGETMAEYYAEGLLARLLGLNDPQTHEVDGLVNQLLQLYTFYIIPNMNPDGTVRGHLRTNACGANLNREWANSPVDSSYTAPTLERSPEVYHVLNKMDEIGRCDVFLDIHGDEELPYTFLFGGEGTPAWEENPRLEAIHGAFASQYSRVNTDIQKEVGYEPPTLEEGKNLTNIACKQIAQRFKCFSATLEMPFKDCVSNPNPRYGWSPNRSKMLGASVLEPLAYIHPLLTSDKEFWTNMPECDAYVTPVEKFE